ncbi:hypothetical protein M409DRAFT_18675 [Zasmidium cellare ATCC 36951]|uniref:Uncharacterized protein n=1 Tax=Zasmidium cellare ATCC 36951 TaxID=1080233 RepID=A0A6A6CXW4_ZASCE|nr:uncharacterized protein M409DRAFT_18675 [Zasmidium cellare ATCC 36951]KAF2171563.1 hypothetical protein M409DRAFT_18675 [Zasmidium cellare ATCC 36951]
MLSLPNILLPLLFLTPFSTAHATPSTHKLEYGRYTVPSRASNNGMLEITDQIDPPCKDCLITFMQVALEYADGSDADADTGMWMHHFVFVNDRETTYEGETEGHPFFASGNERTALDLTGGGQDPVGYHFRSTDRLTFYGELMNMLYEEQTVVLSVLWEYVIAPYTDYALATPYWLNIGGFGDSDRPAANNSRFTYSSPTLTPDFHGRIVFIGSHLHDGGTLVEVFKNGEVLCGVKPVYGESKGESADGALHIVAMPVCLDAGRVQPGDQFNLTATFDTFEYAPMVNNDGSLEPIMGVAVAYVVKDDGPPVKREIDWKVWIPLGFVLLLLLVAGFAGVRAGLRSRRRYAEWLKREQYQPVHGDEETDAFLEK